jgi:hypothetical protein
MRGQHVHLVTWIHRYDTLCGNIATDVAGDVFASEVGYRSIVLDAAHVSCGLWSNIIVTSDLPRLWDEFSDYCYTSIEH